MGAGAIRTQAVRVHAPGGPEVLRLEELELAAPARGEARLRQLAMGLNFIDVYHRSGSYPPPTYPFTPGLEGAGVVEELGPGVEHLRVGDRVAYAAPPPGAYAAHRNVAADKLVRLPPQLDERIAAAAMLKGLTAWYLLRKTYPVGADTTLLVHAAAGGVGSLLCQWGRRLGARVIGTVGSEEKAAQALADGCEHAILYAREDFVARTRELTGGRGCDVVYDSVGQATLMGSLACLVRRGLLVSFGQSSGTPDPLPLSLLAGHGSLYVTRPTLMDYTATRAELEQGAGELFALLAAGDLSVHIGATLPLSQVAQAHRDLEARATRGSTILVPET